VGNFLLLALAAVSIVLPHALRTYAARHPLGPFQWQMRVKDGPMLNGLVPSMAGDWEARRYGEAALNLVPKDALVIGSWKEIMVFYYLRYAEHRREDLALDPYDQAHRVRLLRWQAAHDVATHPFVFLSRIPVLAEDIRTATPFVVTPGETLFVRREPIR
jgi:hypothetical protein